MIALLFLMTLGFTTLTTVIIGITVSDIYAIHTARALGKHPHARRWRNRPVVYVVIHGAPTQQCREGLRASRYKKLTIAESAPDDSVALHIQGDTVLEPNAITDAIRQLNDQPSTSSISLTPRIQRPTTTMELFHVYSMVAKTPFHIVRSLIGTWSHDGAVLMRQEGRYVRHFTAASRVMKLGFLSLFIYALFAAVTNSQPQLLLIYVLSLWLWLIWTIERYPHLSIRQKLVYSLLSPVSFIYFAYLLATAPFRFTRRQVATRNAIMNT